MPVLLGELGDVAPGVCDPHPTMITSAISPTMLRMMLIVVPITINVIAIAVMNGMMLGPGRCICSPAGGA